MANERETGPMNPGSAEAIAAGCTCPVLDNNRGRGAYIDKGVAQFWIAGNCPMHAPKSYEIAK